jgi:predicted nucleic acid-binding protein
MPHDEHSSVISPPGGLRASLEREDYATIVDLESRYEDPQLGFADCALVVLADRYRTDRVVSFDERHFRAVTPTQGTRIHAAPR